MNDGKNMPANAPGAQEVAEESRDIAQPVRLISVDRVVVFGKGLFEKLRPKSVEFGEAFADEAVEFRECALLRAAFNHHGR